MGLHLLDLIVIVGVAALLFGPKTLQSLSHSVGRGAGQVKDTKDKLLADLPVEDLARVRNTISQIPLSPQQVVQKAVSSAMLPDEKKAAASSPSIEMPAEN